MRKFIFSILTLGLLFSCSDGDLQIETIDFDSVAVQYCSAPVRNAGNLMFKINESEALILQLQSGVLNNGIVGDTIVTESTVPGQSQVTYRVFSDAVDNAYFCDDIPVVEPTVIDEVIAEDGLVIVETMLAENDSTLFVHNISLSGISFVTGNGERITNLAINEFGEVTTTVPN
ncbi:hypothetical protein [Flagellimonas halotolerans]|uniref:Uncharacterized protein n=1 Tax=Flagellimonas halotolerans TaxID=3112164 RepID=A0ABU6IQM4_9FLAO|nr:MULTISPECIES: hypothetical protein [unclassified Allomuricauda]MEC3965505.1 hypothetical protein [Muricauda sp. SYSU M86414]MEC4265371.1 hypothetical protein [Muricauda sp. SYSU M84420]